MSVSVPLFLSCWDCAFKENSLETVCLSPFFGGSVRAIPYLQFSQFSRSVVSDSLRSHEPPHARPPCPSPTLRVHPNPCPLSPWWHPTISSSVVPFSSRLQSFPASGSFQMRQFFASGGHSTGVSALTSILPMNTQDWFPLGLTGCISLLSKGLSRIFSNTTVQKHQIVQHSGLFIVQLSHPCMTTGKILALTRWIFLAKYCFCFLICCLGQS